MIVLWGALIGAVLFLVDEVGRDWWNDRRDAAALVDPRYRRVCEALRVTRDAVQLPPFQMVAPPLYDQDAEGAA